MQYVPPAAVRRSPPFGNCSRGELCAFLLRIVLCTSGAIGTAHAEAAAPMVYWCNNSYSALPCNGATPVKVDDTRTNEQKTQADQSTQRMAAMADKLEKTRLKKEAVYAREQRIALRKQAALAAAAQRKQQAALEREQKRAQQKMKKRNAPYKAKLFNCRGPDCLGAARQALDQ